jgi:putative sugar O-methyltransferase
LQENALFLKRVKYFAAKIGRAWADGTLRNKAGRFLVSSVATPLDVTTGYLRLTRQDRRLNPAAGFADHRGKAEHHRSDPEHLRRIIAAYKAAKQAQQHAPAVFEIRGLWAEWINVNYRDLVRALNAEDTAALAGLFENLQREQFTIGTGSGYDEYVKYRTSLTGRLYVRTVWCRYRDKFQSLGEPEEAVHYPLVGNPAGICLNGDVVQIHAFRHAYHALEMHRLLQNIPNAVVVEIGGGIGGQAYQAMRTVKTPIAKYLVFDIPEVAAICSYFLLSALPDRRIRLYGEGPVSVSDSEDYELAVFPHFDVARLPEQSVDLYHNACSFSEMDSVSAAEYLRIIERTCCRYFSHINHEVRFRYRNPDGSTSLNLIGSELVPDPRTFNRIFKKPRVFCLPEDRLLPAFEYLYERKQVSQ